MKRLKIMKAYAVLWLFIYFLVYSNLEAMATFFFATLTFNLAVLTILIIGIIVIMKSSINLVMLAGTFGILAYKKDNLTFYLQGIEKIMPANIAHMFNSRAEKGVLLFTSEESRSVIEWIDEKFSHQNRYINYFIGTSLMIGLLGTFTGLLVSIDQMGKIILSLSGDIDLGAVIASFAGPLGGMAIGFGSSLFGVVSAIILGLMGYILNKNQEALIEGVEDWLKGRIIDSGGATAGAPSITGDGADLPQHRNSFMDVFIDNISSLTKEMAKISVTNERLHSITIASVQQTRDEHEVNYELFESMNTNLVNINATTKESATTIEERLNSLEEIIVNGQKIAIDELRLNINNLSKSIIDTLNVNSDKLSEQSDKISQILNTLDIKLKTQLDILTSIDSVGQSTNGEIVQTQERLESLRSEVQGVATILNSSEEVGTQNIQKVLTSLSTLASKLQSEMGMLETLEKLHKIQINDIRKQNKIVESIDTKQAEGSSSLQSAIVTLQEKMSQDSEANSGLVAQKLETLESLLNIQTENQDKDLLAQETSKEILEKQNQLLEVLVGKNDENLNAIRKISINSANPGEAMSFTSIDDDKKAPGFFSRLFK